MRYGKKREQIIKSNKCSALFSTACSRQGGTTKKDKEGQQRKVANRQRKVENAMCTCGFRNSSCETPEEIDCTIEWCMVARLLGSALIILLNLWCQVVPTRGRNAHTQSPIIEAQAIQNHFNSTCTQQQRGIRYTARQHARIKVPADANRNTISPLGKFYFNGWRWPYCTCSSVASINQAQTTEEPATLGKQTHRICPSSPILYSTAAVQVDKQINERLQGKFG